MSKLSTFTTESSHIYFLWVKTKLTGSKDHISVQIDQKQSKRRLFGHKMTSYVEIGVRYDKKFFFNFIYSYYWVISYILFWGKNGVKWVKKLKISKKTCFPYISYIKSLLNVYFTKTSLTTPVPPLFRGQTKVFPNLQTHMLLTKPV